MRTVSVALLFLVPAGGCLDDPPQHAPPYDTFPIVSFSAKAREGQIDVRHADGAVSWRDVEVSSSRPVRFALNQPVDETGRLLADRAIWERVALQSQSVRPGDRVAFCEDAPHVEPPIVRLRHAASAQRLGSFELAQLSLCTAGT